ncbi:hypothetical protein [Armatimonas rosea]|uniref:REase AHJR-like domain-containing protein n=1 Tax=Armatimonas rosea TaxID=685828 RepID=A0A7W9W860_ARMRO|nr:hypothetical protein [Armatimonas rosea]MBB6052413.1 hypothetical protein [Armatimonas rosea]
MGDDPVRLDGDNLMKSVLLISYDDTLAELARELAAEGFSVQCRPSIAELPAFIATSTRIDLIARRPDKCVVVALRTHAEFSRDRELIELAKRIDAEQGWQLQLVVYDAVMSEKFENPEPPHWTIEEIQKRWMQLKHRQGQPCSEQEVADVLQLAEAILCTLDPTLREGSASWRLRQSFTDGWLSQEQLGVILRALEERRGILDLTKLLGWRELLSALEPLVQSVIAANASTSPVAALAGKPLVAAEP